MDAHAREPSGGVESAEDGFLSRASRGSVAFRVGESRRARRSTPSPVSSLEFQTVHRPTSDFKPRALQRYFSCTPRGTLIARRASVAVRALPPVAMASRSALRRGIAAFAEATRGLATGNALARQGGVTANRYDAPAIYLWQRTQLSGSASSPPEPTSRATVQEADPRARDPRRAARRKRPPKSGGGDARTIARSDTARAAPREPIPRRRSGQSFFVLPFRHTGVPPFSRTPPGRVSTTRKGTETSIRVLFFFSDPLSSRAIASTPARIDFSHSPSR